MEIDEIFVLVDEVGCQSVVKIQKLIRLFVIIIMSADKLQSYQFCCLSYLSISQVVFDH